MNNFNLSYLDDPKVSSVNTLDDHSDHEIYVQKKSISKSLNGKWSFKYFDHFNDDLIKYIDQNYDLSTMDNIEVPSEIEMSGFSSPQYVNQIYPWFGKENVPLGKCPKDNPLGIFSRDVKVDNLNNNTDLVLKFNGFEGALYLYINGNFVGYSEKNYVNSEFLINSFLKEGNNRIVIFLFKYSKGSWFLDMDMWRLFGIIRDVELISYPSSYIFDIDNKSILEEDNSNGNLDITLKFKKDQSDELTFKYSLTFKGNEILNDSIKIEQNEINITKKIKEVHPYSAEEPNLYNLDLSLRDEKKEIMNTSILIGFKNMIIKDGVILLNGKKLIIKGINRHEFDPLHGRAIDKKTIEDDVKLIKANNMNTIRTSHYPNNSYLYHLCDIYGLYVIDETPLETHGTWGSPFIKIDKNNILPKNHLEFNDFLLEKAKSMYKRDRNHNSIIMWSLGNEAYGGEAFKVLSDFFHSMDKNRLVHYEGVVHDEKYNFVTDVRSEMYTSAKNISKYLKKHTKKPFMLCEFEHSMGNSTGNFDEYMDLFKFKNFHGGCVWDFVDQGIYDKDRDCYLYGGDFNDRPNNNNFCSNGVLLASREKTAKLDTLKFYYQDLTFSKKEKTIQIKNNNNFISTYNYYFVVSLYENGEFVKKERLNLEIAPKEVLDLDISKYYLNSTKELLLRITYHLKEDTVYASKDYEVGFFESLLNSSLDKGFLKEVINSNKKLELIDTTHVIGVKGDGFNYIFNGKDTMVGGLNSISINNEELLAKNVALTLFRPTTDNDRAIYEFFATRYIGYSKYSLVFPFLKDIKVDNKNENYIDISYKHHIVDLPRIKNYTIEYRVYSSGDIKVKLTYHLGAFEPTPSAIGIDITLPFVTKEFTYYGLGPKDNYIDRYEGEKLGIYTSSPKDEYVDYSIPQECGNHLFTRYIIIKTPLNQKFGIYSLDKSLSFKILPFSEFEIENATHKDELPSPRYTTISIFNDTRGVGGDDSWFNPVHKKYKIHSGKHIVEFVIKKLD